MQLQRHSNQRTLILDTSHKLGSGGEGVIYAVEGDARHVAKVYHKPTAQHKSKLLAMYKNPPDDPMRAHGHASIAWPVDLLCADGGSGKVVGFLMPRVTGVFSVIDLFVPKSRLQKCPLFTYQYLHRAGRNIAAAVAPLHARGYVVGDINESNILVSTSALVSLVDTDSFQVREAGGPLFRCGVGKAEFTPPELQGRNLREVDRAPAHDLFGLAVLIFQLLMEGTHPFAGQFTGSGEPPGIVQRIQQGEFPYDGQSKRFAPSPTAPNFESLDPELQELFKYCFRDGHSSPNRRPTAAAWQEALDRSEARLKRCRKNAQHRYGRHLAFCPWCARAELLGGRDYFPSQRAVNTGGHLATPAPKQLPLPELKSAAAQPAPAAAKPKKRRKAKSRAADGLRTKWAAFTKSSPTAYVSLCAICGAAALGTLRFGLALLPAAHSWVAAGPGLHHNASFPLAPVLFGLSLAALAGAWRLICRK